MWHIICYDISDDRRRTRVARLLDDVGDRIQFSVFEVRLPAEAISHLVDRLEQEIDLQTDVVSCFAICEACRDRARTCGTGSPLTEELVWIV
ncbi:MAG: CRISPR-associated endonuclease Cas2 [Phycisphaerales bacterium]|nr:CRISPR-associated endonuclease Cas2 [Phycisphaerales bacterium]MCB9855312.1 CRISPR-associated endonuclease Cas2 [Phycisphaerales bacterium]MCB9862905.1 CRISPR-associated endonuclease Cas2 [Phycisphaerales bacterium]